ncbi:MAG: hypothetical protein OIF48_05435 [Silicimonas sp.]|nr:hypothetical protein [Silicimonas sp.]
MAAILLPACGVWNRVAPSWFAWCPINAQAQVETRLAALEVEALDLRTRIAARERELALMQCTPKPPVIELPPLKDPGPPPIDREAWTERDIASLEGCWELDSNFSTTHRDTGEQSTYKTWRICFDTQGNGEEEMRADNGNTCSGIVRSQFNARGVLEIEEPANLRCSDGGFIYRLSSRCTLKGDGTAACEVSQPEVGRSAILNFRRATR